MEDEKIYRAGLTREPFLLREMQVTARLLMSGLSDEDIIEKVYHENLFQYPTEKSLQRMAKACLRRLHGLDDEEAVRLMATAPTMTARQICLYAILKDSQLVLEFMMQVVAVHYRQHNTAFSRADILSFFLHLQGQSEQVAGWSDSTIKKIISVMMGMLVQMGYLKGPRSTELQMVYLQPDVRRIMERHDHGAWTAMFYTVG